MPRCTPLSSFVPSMLCAATSRKPLRTQSRLLSGTRASSVQSAAQSAGSGSAEVRGLSPRGRGISAARFSVARMGDGASTRGQPLETLLEELDPSSSELAREALGWILPEPCPDPSRQIELQEFLWCQLSFTWLAEAGELPEIAWSLADLFTAAGLERDAALC